MGDESVPNVILAVLSQVSDLLALPPTLYSLVKIAMTFLKIAT